MEDFITNSKEYDVFDKFALRDNFIEYLQDITNTDEDNDVVTNGSDDDIFAFFSQNILICC